METPAIPPQGGQGATTDALAESEAFDVVRLRERDFQVYGALSRLQGRAEFWRGTKQEIGAEVGRVREDGAYDERTIYTSLKQLEPLGLVSWSDATRPRTYFLRAVAPSGRPFAVLQFAAESPVRTGRDVVRGARPVSAAAAKIAALVASIAEEPEHPAAGSGAGSTAGSTRIGGPDRPGSAAPVSAGPTMSSSSSSSSIHLPPPPATDPASGSPASPGTPPPADEPMPEGWEEAVRELVEIDCDPHEDLVRRICELTDLQRAWLFPQLHRYAVGRPPSYVWACIDSAERMRPAPTAAEGGGDSIRGSASDDASGERAQADAPGAPPSAAGALPAGTGAIPPSAPAPATTPTPEGTREPTHLEAKGVLLREMHTRRRPLVEVHLPPLPVSPGAAADVVMRAGRSLGRGLAQEVVLAIWGGRRRRNRGGS